VKLIASDRFKKARAKLPDDVRTAVDEALRTFMKDPRHPALHFEKLTNSEYRTIRVDRKKWRIAMRGDGGEFELVDVDRHDKIDRKYG